MFDLTAGTIERPFRDKHPSATMLSVATHVAIIGSVAWVVLFSVPDTLPQVPSMMAFVASAPVPSPPPPPPPPAVKAAKAAQVSKPVPTTGPTFTAPTEIPVGIQPESGIDLGGEGGVVGGVEGGIPGGVLGGILGGMVTEAPPPLPPPARQTQTRRRRSASARADSPRRARLSRRRHLREDLPAPSSSKRQSTKAVP